jgi:hypothetical protein
MGWVCWDDEKLEVQGVGTGKEPSAEVGKCELCDSAVELQRMSVWDKERHPKQDDGTGAMSPSEFWKFELSDWDVG